MTAVLAPYWVQQYLNQNGTAVAVGGLLFTYKAGTTTKQATYTDSTQSTPLANPIVLDSTGSVPYMWLDPTLVYKFVLAPPNDTDPPVSAYRTIDNIYPSLNTSSNIGILLYPQTAAEIAVSVTPVNYLYPEGFLYRYGTNTVPGTTDMTAALNAATNVCAYGKAVLQLPPASIGSPILITGTWDCTAKYTGPFAYPNNTNGGIWIRGAGKASTYIQYRAGTNNTGIGWDMGGCSFGRFEGFTFIGGTSTSNCPQCTLLQGAINVSGIIRSLNHTWLDVEIDGYGDYVVQNNGAEQQNFIDCTSVAYRDNTFGSAVPWTFVASGSNPVVSSVLATTFTPINSMTVCHWHGANAAMIFHGAFGILFHFTGTNAGACADIRFDDWYQVLTPSGAFKHMTDDSSGAAGTGLFNCGGERVTMEVATANGNIQMGSFAVALPKGIKFEGHAGSGNAISARPFQFAATAVPTNCEFTWDPNESAAWTGDYIVQCAGTEAGLKVVAPVGNANLFNVTNSRTIDSFPGNGQTGQGTDYAQVLGTFLNVGAGANGQFNRSRKVRAANFVTGNSDWNEGVQTTQNVANVATNILALPNFANLVIVTGANAGGDKFCDLLFCTFVGATVLSSLTDQGAPAARTYTFAANTLKLAMGTATTLNIQASCLGFGMQI